MSIHVICERHIQSSQRGVIKRDRICPREDGRSREIWSVCALVTVIVGRSSYLRQYLHICACTSSREVSSAEKKTGQEIDLSKLPSPGSLSQHPRDHVEVNERAQIFVHHIKSCTRQYWRLCSPTSVIPELGGTEGRGRVAKATQLAHNERGCIHMVHNPVSSHSTFTPL